MTLEGLHDGDNPVILSLRLVMNSVRLNPRISALGAAPLCEAEILRPEGNRKPRRQCPEISQSGKGAWSSPSPSVSPLCECCCDALATLFFRSDRWKGLVNRVHGGPMGPLPSVSFLSYAELANTASYMRL